MIATVTEYYSPGRITTIPRLRRAKQVDRRPGESSITVNFVECVRVFFNVCFSKMCVCVFRQVNNFIHLVFGLFKARFSFVLVMFKADKNMEKNYHHL